MKGRHTLAAGLAGCALVMAACGDSGSSGANATAALPDSVKVAPALEQAKDARGTITYCAGKDLAGDLQDLVTRFNQRYASQGLKADLLEFPSAPDEQRSQFVQRQEAESGECDVFWTDVIWTAEFAAQGWLLDMSAYVGDRKDEFIPSTLETVKYGERYFGVPKQTDAGFIYHRTDRVRQAPATWQELYATAADEGGIVYQGASYEGLTVDFLELAFAAGGSVLSEDGTRSVINSPENIRALEFMVQGVENGAAPKAVTTYMEEEARRAFESGRHAFMRNWPYAFALGNKADAVKGRFAVAPLPSFEGAGRGGVLGGHNLVISAFSENPEAALLLVDFATSPELDKRAGVAYSQAPVLSATYDDPALQRALPFSAELKQAVEQAKARPVSPFYPQISQAIYKNVNAALAGQMSPEEALNKADAQITKALETF